jgi:anti-anti-sigma factor
MEGISNPLVRVETSGDESIAFVTGELDITGAKQLRQALDRFDHPSTDDGKVSRVVVDLSGCSFMDSSGLSAIIGAHKRLTEAKVDLVIRQPTDKVFRVFDITGMTSVFTIER